MKRDLLQRLIDWKQSGQRKPLLLRGARQVGKTWLIRELARGQFDNLIEINFEYDSKYRDCFSSLDPKEIVAKIELLCGKDIEEGHSLLFFDEVQQCPDAIRSLRYFYENMPELHVVAAGSLLEFALGQHDISMPVGRVQNLFLSPLSFGEFLDACGESKYRAYLSSLKLSEEVNGALFSKGFELLQKYLFIGGMPEAVDSYIQTNKYSQIREIHSNLLQNYQDDFNKYSKRVNRDNLEAVFNKSGGLVGKKFKYAHIDSEKNTTQLKQALGMLCQARVMHQVHATSGSGLPMETYKKERFFKVIYMDVGLLQTSMGLGEEIFRTENLLAVYQGAIAEQFVGQQLLSLFPSYEDGSLFYWQREARGSEAEVDYLWQSGESVIPLEVKHGKRGTLKSLKLFQKEHNDIVGVRISMHPLSVRDNILSVPLFAIESLPHLLSDLL